ncbi:branched-chain amino acid ABC transporter permease [Pseudorhodoferax sp. Leaf267]|uniref:branched-chain amino acid ABC transporter permease n=1 Tax=Pseudorhodoferax sp. Leaf267 TaxID=1736316 RepID=UPI0006F8F40D|nr:branched-chain amino acid ABC transporter permease [Pseudorhodoferax sp. Leaf267]KQP22146.1 ABC transporter permease [Pseudorhodoferax sp. Leaf267]
MSATLVLQAALAGITSGFVYALIGIGIAVIFRGSHIINAMQGEFAVLGALVAVFALAGWGWPYPLAIAAGVLVGAATGAAVDALLVRPMKRRNASEESFLLLTIGLALTLSAAALYFAGRDSHLLPSFAEGVLEIGGATIAHHALWLIAVAMVVVLALHLFYRHTLLGLSMAAASADPDGATSVGIDVDRARLNTFLLGGAVGAVAGILVTPLIAMHYHMGIVYTLKGFAAAILGGIANPIGAVAGGLALGLLESLAAVGFPSGYRDAVAMALLIVIMIVLPNGLLGRAGRAGG